MKVSAQATSAVFALHFDENMSMAAKDAERANL